MRYENIKEGIFLKRPNRFIAHIEIDGVEEICHVKNTGRCKELLLPGSKVFVEESKNPNRKTKYDLISVYKGETLINMDSQVPNKVVYEWIQEQREGTIKGPFSNATFVKPEFKFGDSRIDVYLETTQRNIITKHLVEVKGVTLELDGVAAFPDAPTVRGVKHVKELMGGLSKGYESWIIFVIQMKGITSFRPYQEHDPDFAKILKEAKEEGVNIVALDSIVTRDSISVDKPIKINL